MSELTEVKIHYGQYEVPDSDVCVCLNVGQPSNSQLPLNEYKHAMTRVLEKNDPSLLQYGKIQGYDKFRKELANFLSNSYTKDREKISTDSVPITVDHDNLVITNGNTGALQLLLSLYAEKGMTIFVEDPTYFLALDTFRDFGLNIKSVSIDEYGLDVNELENLLQNEDPLKRCLLYTIPIHQNPTGFTMSTEKRTRLSDLATIYPNLLVICDEVYHMLSFETNDTIVFPMCYYHKNFISLGSFSKIFCPAIRLGWIHSINTDIINKIVGCGQLDSSGNVNPLGCAIMDELILGGELHIVLEKWKHFLSDNCASLYSALTTILKDDIEHVNYPNGGYFLWVRFKSHINTVELAKVMEQYGVKFHHGNKFSSSKNSEQYMRLSFSWYQSANDYNIACTRLKKLIDENHYIPKNVTVSNEQDKLNVYVLGYKGKLGSLIVKELSTCFCRGLDRDLKLEGLTNNSIIIDVSSPHGTEQLLTTLLNSKLYCSVVIGTTGVLPNELIRKYGEYAPIVVTSNFSKGIVQMNKLIDVVDKTMWKVTLLEKHHVLKKDAPSGTAKLLAKHYGTTLLPYDKISSVREGEIIGEHHLTLEGDNEYITISHIAKTRNLFAEGSLEWIKWIVKQPNGVYDSM